VGLVEMMSEMTASSKAAASSNRLGRRQAGGTWACARAAREPALFVTFLRDWPGPPSSALRSSSSPWFPCRARLHAAPTHPYLLRLPMTSRVRIQLACRPPRAIWPCGRVCAWQEVSRSPAVECGRRHLPVAPRGNRPEAGFTERGEAAPPIGLPGRKRLIRPGDASSVPRRSTAASYRDPST
jgi:hypothetical protein